jgi:hypothetical protein
MQTVNSKKSVWSQKLDVLAILYLFYFLCIYYYYYYYYIHRTKLIRNNKSTNEVLNDEVRITVIIIVS